MLKLLFNYVWSSAASDLNFILNCSLNDFLSSKTSSNHCAPESCCYFMSLFAWPASDLWKPLTGLSLSGRVSLLTSSELRGFWMNFKMTSIEASRFSCLIELLLVDIHSRSKCWFIGIHLKVLLNCFLLIILKGFSLYFWLMKVAY